MVVTGQLYTGGYQSKGGIGLDVHRDCLWLSPHCLRPADNAQLSLLGAS